uniref:Uncharacterized protein n=1 Tax=Oryza glumipatula TaxID=40148 RepID=A0A0D9ZX98_9ORYZ
MERRRGSGCAGRESELSVKRRQWWRCTGRPGGVSDREWGRLLMQPRAEVVLARETGSSADGVVDGEVAATELVESMSRALPMVKADAVRMGRIFCPCSVAKGDRDPAGRLDCGGAEGAAQKELTVGVTRMLEEEPERSLAVVDPDAGVVDAEAGMLYLPADRTTQKITKEGSCRVWAWVGVEFFSLLRTTIFGCWGRMEAVEVGWWCRRGGPAMQVTVVAALTHGGELKWLDQLDAHKISTSGQRGKIISPSSAFSKMERKMAKREKMAK